MKRPAAWRPYQPLRLNEIREEIETNLLEILFVFSESRRMSLEEHLLQMHYAYVELQRIAKRYGYDPSQFPGPELKGSK